METYEAYEKGMAACKNRLKIDACPYRFGEPERSAWLAGWMHQHEEETK
jgi:ribosome modulation factor